MAASTGNSQTTPLHESGSLLEFDRDLLGLIEAGL